jgi:hypothetical protein
MSIAAKRVLAVVVALALIGGAFGIRALLDGNGGGGGGSDGPPDRALRLLCASELGACDALAGSDLGIDVTIAPAGVSADELSRSNPGDLPYDGWLTLGREAEIVRDARERTGLPRIVGSPSPPIGRSPLVLAIWKDRADVLAARCGGKQLDWKCIGDVAGAPWSSIGGSAAWGTVKPGHADPATDGIGLLVIGQAATQYFGRTDLSRDDYADDGFLDWFGRLERSIRFDPGSAFGRMLVGGPAIYDVVGTTEAEAGPLLAAASADRRAQLRLLYPAPVASADVVYAPITGGSGGDDLRDLLTGDDGRAALARAGWRVDGEPRAKGVRSTPVLPARPNLPTAGSLEALLETWREVTG